MKTLLATRGHPQLVIVAANAIAHASPARSSSTLTFSTSMFTLHLNGDDGTVVGFTDVTTGSDYASTPPQPFLRAEARGRGEVPAESLQRAGPTGVVAVFSWPHINASMPALHASVDLVIKRVGDPWPAEEFLSVTVVTVSSEEVDALWFAQLSLVMERHGNGRCQNGCVGTTFFSEQWVRGSERCLPQHLPNPKPNACEVLAVCKSNTCCSSHQS